MIRKRSMTNKLSAEINIVPYIDVMLVLLVIFMVTAPLLQQGVAVDLPKASAKTLPTQDVEPMVVSVDKHGNYFLNISDFPARPIDQQALVLRVAAELKRNPARKVLVKGDQRVDYGRVVSAMVLMQQAGAEGVGLITEDQVVVQEDSEKQQGKV